MDYDKLEWKPTDTSACTHIYIDKKNKLIYKKYSKDKIIKIYDNYNKVKQFNFVPKMVFDFKYNIIIEKFYKKPLHYYTKPLNYKSQLLHIHKTLRQHNLYHNDYKNGLYIFPFFIHHGGHFFVDEYQHIILIDWDNLSVEHQQSPFHNDINGVILYCKHNFILYTILFEIIVIVFIIFLIKRLQIIYA